MENQLEQLRKVTTVVADTGDIEAISLYQPQDATTNPSLILKAAKLPVYENLLTESIKYAKTQSNDIEVQVQDACDMLAVSIGKEILNVVPGRISTEVSATLSYDMEGSLTKARKLIKLYNQAGIPNERVLIKLASTWEGIQAAKILEKEGVNCNLTLLFSFAQAQACAEAEVFLISPFVGRIMDWYKKDQGCTFTPQNDPGVKSVTKIYNYYKEHGIKTIVMGASFRNLGEITELAGCDRLTISPDLLKELKENNEKLSIKLSDNVEVKPRPEKMTHEAFLWEHNQDAMAVDKLAEGIRNFAIDQLALEKMIQDLLQS